MAIARTPLTRALIELGSYPMRSVFSLVPTDLRALEWNRERKRFLKRVAEDYGVFGGLTSIPMGPNTRKQDRRKSHCLTMRSTTNSKRHEC